MPSYFIQGLHCPWGAVDGKRRFCTTRAKTTRGSGAAWRPWQPCDRLTSKASRQKHNSCLTHRLRSRANHFKSIFSTEVNRITWVACCVFHHFFTPYLVKAWGEVKGNESWRLMENNGAGREQRASSCKQWSPMSGSLHRNLFEPPTLTRQRPPRPVTSIWALHAELRWDQMKLLHRRIKPVSNGQMRFKCREEMEGNKERSSNDYDFHGRWKVEVLGLPARDKGEQTVGSVSECIFIHSYIHSHSHLFFFCSPHVCAAGGAGIRWHSRRPNHVNAPI